MSEPPIIIATPPPLIRRQVTPIATLVIFVLNITLYVLMELAGGSMNPDVLLKFGASFGPFIQRGEYWRLVMPMFLHIGVAHLILNTVGLLLLGRVLESVYGYGRFAVLYVASGMGSSFLSMKLSQGVSAGASGAIFGMAGAMLTVGYLHREMVPRRWRRAFGGGILPLIVLNLALGFSIPGIDNWGHIGGLFVGMAVSGLLRPPGFEAQSAPDAAGPSQMMVVIPVVIVLLAMGAAIEHHRLSRTILSEIEESRRLRAAGRFDQAIQRAQDAARLAPRDERPREELGSLYLHQGRIDEAIREYDEAHRLNPLSPAARRGLVGAYLRKGDSAKALQVFEEILGARAQNAEGRRFLGDLCLEDKLYREAIHYYEEALRLDPNDAATHNNLAWLLATSEDEQFRDPERALAHAQKAVALDGWKEAAFIDTLAEALYVNGRFDEAVETQTKALERDPANREYQDHMARYRQAAGVS
jgi:membrane associated rhomboid family serine protease/Flp pilus assembly protein TadD